MGGTFHRALRYRSRRAPHTSRVSRTSHCASLPPLSACDLAGNTGLSRGALRASYATTINSTARLLSHHWSAILEQHTSGIPANARTATAATRAPPALYYMIHATC